MGKASIRLEGLFHFISLVRRTPDCERDSESHHECDAASEKTGAEKPNIVGRTWLLHNEADPMKKAAVRIPMTKRLTTGSSRRCCK